MFEWAHILYSKLKVGGCRVVLVYYLASTTVGFAEEFERRLQLGLERHWLWLGDGAVLLHRPPGLVHLPPALPHGPPGLHQVWVAPAGLGQLVALAVRLAGSAWFRPSSCLVLLLDPHGHNHLRGEVGRTLVGQTWDRSLEWLVNINIYQGPVFGKCHLLINIKTEMNVVLFNIILLCNSLSYLYSIIFIYETVFIYWKTFNSFSNLSHTIR